MHDCNAVEQCPRFDTCNASHCPLSLVGLHLQKETVCYYLLNFGKAGAAERFQDEPTFAACVLQLPQTVAKYPNIGRSVARASKSGFRGQNITKTQHRSATQSDCGGSVAT